MLCGSMLDNGETTVTIKGIMLVSWEVAVNFIAPVDEDFQLKS